MSDLFKLIARGDLDALSAQLERGADPNTVRGAESLLHRAAFCGDERAIRLLVSHGAVIDRSCDGVLPLHVATMEAETDPKYATAIAALLELGATVDATSDQGYTATFWAAGSGQLDVLEMLIRAGASVDVSTPRGWTPLHEAADEDESERAVAVLLDHGANPDARAESGASPAHLAAAKSRARATMHLLERMRQPTLVDHQGWGILHAAAQGGLADVVHWLLKRGADATLATKTGRTPMHYAAMCFREVDNTAVIHALLAQGATLDALDVTGAGPRDVAYSAEAFDRAVKSAPRT